jgi:NAD(P)-dependent dehydrogenase (short-subunit alcohol dehydrogenase family)
MKENNYGRILFTSSTSGLFGNFGQTNYGAAKLGVIGIMNTLKLEMAKYNVKVNAIAPTAYSRMTEDIFTEDMGKKLQPKFNVPLVLYLSSEENNETGRTYVMGAGWYGRTAIVCAEGACIGDTERDIAVEEIRDNFKKIDDLTNAEPANSGADVFKYMGPLLS